MMIRSLLWPLLGEILCRSTGKLILVLRRIDASRSRQLRHMTKYRKPRPRVCVSRAHLQLVGISLALRHIELAPKI